MHLTAKQARGIAEDPRELPRPGNREGVLTILESKSSEGASSGASDREGDPSHSWPNKAAKGTIGGFLRYSGGHFSKYPEKTESGTIPGAF